MSRVPTSRSVSLLLPSLACRPLPRLAHERLRCAHFPLCNVALTRLAARTLSAYDEVLFANAFTTGSGLLALEERRGTLFGRETLLTRVNGTSRCARLASCSIAPGFRVCVSAPSGARPTVS